MNTHPDYFTGNRRVGSTMASINSMLERHQRGELVPGKWRPSDRKTKAEMARERAERKGLKL